jgi:hypothetical protein
MLGAPSKPSKASPLSWERVALASTSSATTPVRRCSIGHLATASRA